MKKLLLAVLACLSLNARADIIYEWQGNNDAAPYNISMRLTFTDTAFDDGVVDLVIPPGYNQHRPDSELLDLYYTAPGRGGRIDFRPVERGIGHYDHLRLQFTMDADGVLSGSLLANNTMLHIGMTGTNGLFMVETSNSDLGMYDAGCDYYIDCKGATGRFVRMGNVAMPEHAELPEPSSIALAAVGLFGLIGIRRRQQ